MNCLIETVYKYFIFIISMVDSKINRLMKMGFRKIIIDRKLKKRYLLDIGCGGKGDGIVNIDLFQGKTPHTSQQYIESRKITNFVNADAHKLPFRDSVFFYTKCSHVLEHLEKPIEAIKEMKRVSKGVSVVYVPSNLNKDRTKTHLYSWTNWTLNNFMKRIFNNVKVILTPYEIIAIGSHARLHKSESIVIKMKEKV